MDISGSVIPVLHIEDISVSREFYEALQFKVDWLWRPPEGGAAFAQISQDGIRIYLNEDTVVPAQAHIYLYVDDVDAWHMRLLAANVPVDKVPHNTAWRNREMHLRDPDGNSLYICTPVSQLQD